MYSEAHPFLLHALSSVHAGSGSEVGIVDLPIQREKHTGYPKIDSSSLKGAIRQTVMQTVENNGDYDLEKHVYDVFGTPPRNKSEDDQAGAIALSDARILLFPVKSMRGIFAYVTCNHVLKRFNDDLQAFGKGNCKPLTIPVINQKEQKAKVSSDAVVVKDQNLVLEEYTYTCIVDDEAKQLADQLAEWIFLDDKEQLKERLVVLPDDDFNDFVSLSTEVNARIHIDPDKGLVENGALFYEENVPPEAVFYSYLFVGKPRKANADHSLSPNEIYELFKNETYFPHVFQLGGNSTLGRGMLKKIWYGEEA